MHVSHQAGRAWGRPGATLTWEKKETLVSSCYHRLDNSEMLGRWGIWFVMKMLSATACVWVLSAVIVGGREESRKRKW